jgi:chromosome partitioning protein
MPLVDLEEVMKLLRIERLRKNLTQKEVARRLGMTDASSVRSLERAGSNPTLQSLQRYAAAIDVSLKLEVERMRSLVFFNHAGGVGKSSSVRDIGFALTDQGFRVLLIDADPQANLTEWLGVTDEVTLSQTIYPAIINEFDERNDLALPPPLRVHGLDLIPSQLDLARLDVMLVGTFNGLVRLRNAVKKLEDYDFVLIDPPPSLGQLSALSVITADHVVVPVPTNSKGLRGIATVMNMVKRYRELSPKLKVSFFLLTQFDERTRHDRESIEAIHAQLAAVAPVSSPLHHRPAIYKDAQLAGKPIPVYKKGDIADREVRSAASQLLEALGVKVSV